MGWKGTMRSIQASARRAERESARNQREYEKYLKQQQKEYEAAQSRQEVDDYNKYIEIVTGVHKESIPTVDWRKLATSNPPIVPVKNTSREQQAENTLNNYRPNFFIKLLRLVNWRLSKLKNKLEEAKLLDESDFQKNMDYYNKQIEIFNFNFEMANKILQGDLEEFAKAIVEYNACESIRGEVDISFLSPHSAEVSLSVDSLDIIPKKTKILLKSNKVSEKNLSTAKINSLYQDYVCGTLFRCARDIFSVLPLDELFFSVESDLLDSSTGYIEKRTILSIRIPRKTMERINFSQIDPSDALKNFVHNMDFKAGEGFKETSRIKVA